jgi:hypothetical protein
MANNMSSPQSSRRYVNPWKQLKRDDLTSYPYPTKPIIPSYSDSANRPAERLHTSMACFGNLLTSSIVERPPNQDFSFESRLFNDVSTADDFTTMLKFLDGYNKKLVKVVDGSTLPNTVDARADSLDDWKPHKRIIVYYHIPPNKWAIFVISPVKTSQQTSIPVHGYLIGDVGPVDLHAFIMQLIFSLHMCFEKACPMFQRRLDVRKAFETSNAFLSFLVLYILTRNGAYLDLTPDHIMKYKILFTRSYRDFHDSWFGQVPLCPKHPFIAKGMDNDDNLSGLVELGWTVVDVAGDGNCGYYCMILGLENFGISTFSVVQKSPSPKTSVKGKSRMIEKLLMKDCKDWQESVVRFRRYLQQHSKYMLRECYPREQRNVDDEMWILAGTTTMEEIDGIEGSADGPIGLSQQIYNEDLKTRQYFTEDFVEKTEYHMNPFWVPHVLASMKKVRVIVYTRVTAKETSWSVTSFDGTTERVIWYQHGDLKDLYQLYEFRPTDEEFKKKPTIEMLFLYGYKEDSTKHFLFLRRSLCDGLPPAPPAVQPSLLNMMKALSIEDDRWALSGNIPEETWKKLRSTNRKQPHNQHGISHSKTSRNRSMDTLASLRSAVVTTGSGCELINHKDGATSQSMTTTTIETRTESGDMIVDEQGMVSSGKKATTTTTSTIESLTQSEERRIDKSHIENAGRTVPATAFTTETPTGAGDTMRTDESILDNSRGIVPTTATTMETPTQAGERLTDESAIDNPRKTVTTHACDTTLTITATLDGTERVPTEATPADVTDVTVSTKTIGETNIDGTKLVEETSAKDNMEKAGDESIDGNETNDDSSMSNEEDVTKQASRKRKNVHETSGGGEDTLSSDTDDEEEDTSSSDTDDEEEEPEKDRKAVFAKSKKQTSHLAYSRKNKEAKRRQRAMDTKTMNQMYRKKEITNSKLFYDLKADKFYSSKPDHKNGGYTKKVLEENPEEFGEFVYETALKRPNEWIGPRLGNAGDDDAPDELCTSERLLFQQHRKPYCLILSLASALHYCGLKKEARWIAETAEPYSKMEADDQIQTLLPMMKNFVPVIGSALMFGKKTKGHSRIKRQLSWTELFTFLTPYPTIIVPILPNGDTTHAFCVVDDLIFDASTPFALKLHMDSVSWIFKNEMVDLHQAYRFCKRWSPKNQRTKGEYKHKVTQHWDRSAMGLPAIKLAGCDK